MKNIIAVAGKNRGNRELLAIENINITVIAEIAKVLSIINLGNKYNEAISNTDIDTAKNLGLIDIKKYWRCASQIQDKVDGLYKD